MDVFIKNELWLKYRKHFFLMLFLTIFTLGFLHAYFLNLTVFKMAERRDNLNKLGEIKRNYQESEIAYIGLTHELDFSLAQSLGFVEATPSKFVYRQKAVAQQNYGEVFR